MCPIGGTTRLDKIERCKLLFGGDWMIDLSQHTPLRASRNYKIFQHPTHNDALLKVRCDEPVRNHILPRYGEWRYGNLRQWHREASEYLAALNRGCAEIDRLSRFMGYATTSEGPAIVVEKVTGPDGELAPTARQELKGLNPDDPKFAEIGRELSDLIDDLERGKLIVGDFSLDNVVRSADRGGKFVIIDGLGERVLFPLAIFSGYAFRHSIKRRRKRYLKRFEHVL